MADLGLGVRGQEEGGQLRSSCPLYVLMMCFKINLLEKHKRKFAERKRTAKTTTMNKISIEGARMDL